MKLISKLAAVLAVAVTLTSSTFAMPATAENTNAKITVLVGDANNDWMVTLTDSLRIQEYLLGLSNPTIVQLLAMDVNEDSVIDQADYNYLMYKIVNPNVGGF